MNYSVKVDPCLCKSCGICVEFCPNRVLEMRDVPQPAHPEKCAGCGLCEIRCPDFAVEVVPC